MMDIRWVPLLQHIGLFALMVTIGSIVYAGLRREGVGNILKVGLSRAGFLFVVCLLIFGLGGYLLAEWL